MGSPDRFTAASADLMCGRKWIISQAAGARRVSAEGLLPSGTLERQEVEKNNVIISGGAALQRGCSSPLITGGLQQYLSSHFCHSHEGKDQLA